MPFNIEDPKDVWDRIERIKKNFAQRDLMMDEALTALKVNPVALRKNLKGFDDNTANAYLVAQVQAAVIRVALPYRLQLPTLPSMTPSDGVALENMELLLGAFTTMAERNRLALGKRAGLEDRASFAVLRGAICSYVYWQDFSVLDPKRSWEPCGAEYDARHVYFEADQYELNFLFIENYLLESALASYALENAWEGSYNATGTGSIPYCSVWYRKGQEVFGTFVGGPSQSGYGREPQLLQRATVKPMFRSIPVSYFPAGGQAPTVHGVDASYGQTHYGGPFHREMIEPARAITLLDETLMATGHALATPAIQKVTESGTQGSSDLILGQQVTTTRDVEFKPILATRADAMPYLLQKRATLVDVIERLGLSFPLSQGMPRAALLESQLREQAERVLLPYLTPFASAARWIAEQQRAQLHYLMGTEGAFEVEREVERNGIKSKVQVKAITAEVVATNKRTGEKRPETQEFKQDELKWDGQIEAIILPPPLEIMVARNAQVFMLLAQTGQFAIRALKEKLLGMEQPELDALEAARERRQLRLAPVHELVESSDTYARLVAMRDTLAAGAKLGPEDVRFLADVLKEARDKTGARAEQATVALLDVLVGHFRLEVETLTKMLNPPPEKGPAPPPSAEVSPEVAPSQGSPAGNGRTGGGGLVDELAAQIKAMSGSDQQAA